jgi:hypothetical protein
MGGFGIVVAVIVMILGLYVLFIFLNSKQNDRESRISFSIGEVQFFSYALLLVISIPFLSLLISNFSDVEIGQIGDVIGGSTAPIISLIAALLLYKTLVDQRRIQSDQHIVERMNWLREDSMKFSSSIEDIRREKLHISGSLDSRQRCLQRLNLVLIELLTLHQEIRDREDLSDYYIENLYSIYSAIYNLPMREYNRLLIESVNQIDDSLAELVGILDDVQDFPESRGDVEYARSRNFALRDALIAIRENITSIDQLFKQRMV